MEKYNTTKGHDRIRSFLLIFALGVLFIVILLGYYLNNPLYLLVKDLVTLFLTFYIAYVTTQYFAQKTAREDLIDIGISSGRRIFTLSSHLRTLAEEILRFEPDGERSKIYYENIVSQLNRLAIDTELSFKDMQQIAKLDISIPDLVEETRTSVINTIRKELIMCPYCNEKKELLFDTTTAATKHVSCGKCHKPFMIHRLPDGSIKLGIEDTFITKCPNPDCNNEIKIKKAPKDFGVTIRNCFECFARIRFDLDSGSIEGWDQVEPKQIKPSDIVDERLKCPYCSHSNVSRNTHNSKDQCVQFCPNCTNLILICE